MALDKDELKTELDKVFKFMEEKGIKIDDKKKEEFKEKIADQLQNTLSMSDLKDKNVQKKLIGCITALTMNKAEGKGNPFDSLIANLKDDNKRTDELDKNVELKLGLEMKLLKLLTAAIDANKLNLDNNPDNNLKPTPLSQKLRPEPKGAEAGKKDLLAEQLEATLRNLYGGVDPTTNGKIDFPTTGPIVGNILAATNQNEQNPVSMQPIVNAITSKQGAEDPVGLQEIIKIADMSEGVDEDLGKGINFDRMSPLNTHP